MTDAELVEAVAREVLKLDVRFVVTKPRALGAYVEYRTEDGCYKEFRPFSVYMDERDVQTRAALEAALMAERGKK